MENLVESSEKSCNFRRFDDLVRTERYFTATLLPLLLFHNNLEGVRSFVDLAEGKATTECNRSGDRGPKGTTKYDFQDVEVITEFHIARDLKFAGLPLDAAARRGGEGESAEPARDVGPSEKGEPKKDAPDVVIIAGSELVVCEGKFFNGFNPTELNEQLCSQRCQVRHLFLNRPSIRAYRHVAIVPFIPKTAIDADVVLTWADIRDLAKELMGAHYVTDRLREAVERYPEDDGPEGSYIPPWDGKLSFHDMREKCRKSGNEIQVGHVGGEAALLKLSLVDAEEKRDWKWRYPEMNKGHIIPGNWLPGARWLEIVESTRGFGGGCA